MKKLIAPLGLAVLVTTLPASAQEPSPTHAPAPAPAAQAAPASAAAAAPATAAPAPAAPRAFAAPPATAQQGTAGQVIDRMLASLALTPEQKTQTDALRQKFEASTADLRTDIRTRILELRQLRGTQGTDPKLIETKRAELGEVQAKLRAELDKLYEEVSVLLDPAQKEKLEQMRASMVGGSAPATRLPAPTGQKSATAPGHA